MKAVTLPNRVTWVSETQGGVVAPVATHLPESMKPVPARIF